MADFVISCFNSFFTLVVENTFVSYVFGFFFVNLLIFLFLRLIKRCN